MSKLHHRKFARFFPSYHPRAGEPTYFVEKIYASLADTQRDFKIPNTANDYWDWHEYYNCKTPKHHTIRAGHHVKVGDFIRPSVWSGKPYKSKQIIIGPDIEVVKTWDFELRKIHQCGGDVYGFINDVLIEGPTAKLLAQNDGLEMTDFERWFCSPKAMKEPDIIFTGQIICWNKDVNY